MKWARNSEDYVGYMEFLGAIIDCKKLSKSDLSGLYESVGLLERWLVIPLGIKMLNLNTK
jgi:hypothetical protein